MKLTKVHSTQLKAVGWEANFVYDKKKEPKNTLRIEFTNDSIYDYIGVAKSVFESLMKAKSKGKYFIKRIKNKYTTIKREKRDL